MTAVGEITGRNKPIALKNNKILLYKKKEFPGK